MPINPDRPDGSEAPAGASEATHLAAREPVRPIGTGKSTGTRTPSPIDVAGETDPAGAGWDTEPFDVRSEADWETLPTARPRRDSTGSRETVLVDPANRQTVRVDPNPRRPPWSPPSAAPPSAPAAPRCSWRPASPPSGPLCCPTCRWPRSSAWPARWKAPAGSAGRPGAGLAGWLLGHGVPIGTPIGPLGLAPLLLTLLVGWRLNRAGLHVTRAIGARRSGAPARRAAGRRRGRALLRGARRAGRAADQRTRHGDPDRPGRDHLLRHRRGRRPGRLGPRHRRPGAAVPEHPAGRAARAAYRTGRGHADPGRRRRLRRALRGDRRRAGGRHDRGVPHRGHRPGRDHPGQPGLRGERRDLGRGLPAGSRFRAGHRLGGQHHRGDRRAAAHAAAAGRPAERPDGRDRRAAARGAGARRHVRRLAAHPAAAPRPGGPDPESGRCCSARPRSPARSPASCWACSP